MNDEWVSRRATQSRQQPQPGASPAVSDNEQRVFRVVADTLRTLRDLDDDSFQKRLYDLKDAAKAFNDRDVAAVLEELASAAEAEHVSNAERERRQDAANAAKRQRKARNYIQNRLTYLNTLTGKTFQNVVAELEEADAWKNLDERDHTQLHSRLKDLQEREQMHQKATNGRGSRITG